jgi:hypothetical protein
MNVSDQLQSLSLTAMNNFVCLPKDTPITYHLFQDESQLPEMTLLIEKDLSEPYSIFTYRYFIHQWPDLCYLVSRFSEDVNCT